MTTAMLKHEDEAARQRAVTRYHLSGSPGEAIPDLDRLAVQARRLMDADFASINILDSEVQSTIAGSAGVTPAASRRADSLCQRVLSTTTDRDAVIAHADVSQVSGLADSPWVNGEFGSIRSYAAGANARKGRLTWGRARP